MLRMLTFYELYRGISRVSHSFFNALAVASFRTINLRPTAGFNLHRRGKFCSCVFGNSARCTYFVAGRRYVSSIQHMAHCNKTCAIIVRKRANNFSPSVALIFLFITFNFVDRSTMYGNETVSDDQPRILSEAEKEIGDFLTEMYAR